MARSAVVVLGLAAAALSGRPAAATEEPAPAVPADRLPVLGTVGDLPPAAETVVVECDAKGRISWAGHAVDLNGLRQILQPKADAIREESGAKASRLHVVLRVDRDLPWQASQWLMQACSDPAVRVYRVLFAAVPEDGGAEGAIATFLPVDAGLESPPATLEVPPTKIPVKIGFEATGSSVVPRDLHPLFRSRYEGHFEEGVEVEVAAAPSVPTGRVLETVDVAFRSGAMTVLFRGTQLHKTGSLDESVAGIAPAGRVLALTVLEGRLLPPAAGAPTMPPVARVQGRLAGQAEAPRVYAYAAVGVGGGAGGPFGGRRGGKRNLRPEGGGGTEGAVEAGLEWLKNHQSPGGFWDCDGFEGVCKHNKCGGPGGPLYDPGVSGLALLAFLGYGETHKTPRYGHVVRNGLKYLKGIQDAEGCFGPRTSEHFTYNHAIGALAMAEAYGLTQSPLFKASAQNGIHFALQCQNPYLAWRYGVRPQDNDTSVTGWMVMALKAAKGAGLDVDPAAFDGAKAWLDKVTEPEHGRAGYTARGNGPARPQELMDKFPSEKTESLTAIAVLTRIFCGADKKDGFVKKGADLCLRVPPSWDEAAGSIDHYYWYFGTLAMFQVGGDHWKRWNESMKKAIADHQRVDKSDARCGSWDPVDPWGQDGGRIYSTALNVMCLEVYYRYARVFGTKEK